MGNCGGCDAAFFNFWNISSAAAFPPMPAAHGFSACGTEVAVYKGGCIHSSACEGGYEWRNTM
jgi:hypothetical protein